MKRYNSTINKFNSTVLISFSMVLFFGFNAAIVAAQNIKKTEQNEDSLINKAPHGGWLEYNEGYYVELVNTNKKLAFYLYDTDVKPASNKKITGYVVVKAVNKNISKFRLKEVGLNGFTPGNRVFNPFASCQVTLMVKGKFLLFSYKDMRMNLVQYTCPIHPEIVQNEPGQCPKCGMELVEKKDIAKNPVDLKSE